MTAGSAPLAIVKSLEISRVAGLFSATELSPLCLAVTTVSALGCLYASLGLTVQGELILSCPVPTPSLANAALDGECAPEKSASGISLVAQADCPEY